MTFFDFNFYSGDVYGQNTSSLIDFFKTIFATAFGVIITKGYEWWSNRNKIKRAGEDMINEIFLLQEPVNNQIASIGELISLIKEPKTNIPKLTLNTLLNTSRIKDISRTDVIKFFERHFKNRKKAREKGNKIYAALDIIFYHHNQIQILFEKLLEMGTVQIYKCKENTDFIIRSTSKFITELEKKGISPDSDPFITELHLLVKPNFMTGEVVDFLVLKTKFYEPLARLLADNRKDERSAELSDLNYHCLQAIKEFETLNKETIFKFEKIAESLEKQMTLLLEDTKEFQ